MTKKHISKRCMIQSEAEAFYDLEEQLSSLKSLLETTIDFHVRSEHEKAYKMMHAMSTMLSLLQGEYIDLANSIFQRQQQEEKATA